MNTILEKVTQRKKIIVAVFIVLAIAGGMLMLDVYKRQAYHTVTGNKNRKRIFIVGSTNSPIGMRITNNFGQLTVGASFSKRYFLKFRPHALLKRSTFRRKGKGKGTPGTAKVFLKLTIGFIKQRGFIQLKAFRNRVDKKFQACQISGIFSDAYCTQNCMIKER